MRPRLLTIRQILHWADAFRRRTGRWPSLYAGPIAGAAGETWRRVDNALRLGLRGLPGGSSLAQLLAAWRDARNQTNLPRLSELQVLRWADAHRQRTGSWPVTTSGPVRDAPEETWRRVDNALRLGLRGLPGGNSLARTLARAGLRADCGGARGDLGHGGPGLAPGAARPAGRPLAVPPAQEASALAPTRGSGGGPRAALAGAPSFPYPLPPPPG